LNVLNLFTLRTRRRDFISDFTSSLLEDLQVLRRLFLELVSQLFIETGEIFDFNFQEVFVEEIVAFECVSGEGSSSNIFSVHSRIFNLPVFIEEVVLIEGANEILELFLHLLQIDQIRVLLVVAAEVIGEEDSSIVKAFHFLLIFGEICSF
jgi:hypothetical protein